ncbi:Gfo/Idh/MocA family oxidoreductase [Ignisphaera sp. 4213-co]|uniref:Gfo/Idh/MocA family oxidoreductase n=1 Tax=Ignisphaera cupida TaxID=3050454 RepID=A0ABD4Z5A1_9CREN|nr:Gfo/Idh/MocA family oxidoreductase [Ignisphaera sp. 4213-co]MDK6028492.1 Gfo/Idh/MocA family oxidoreductase [Ignisphaera sp. 4213-co]
MDRKIVRYGIIGVGGHGVNRHLVPLLKVSEAKLVAVADIDRARCEDVASKYNTKCYTDYMEMISKEDLDAVSIVTPTGLHAKIAIDVLKRGIHVLVDKPLGANLDEVVNVVKTAKKMNRKLMVGYWSRFSPALQYIKEVYETNLLGEPYYAYGYLIRRRGIPGKPTFIDEKLSGGKGALLDIGCYILDNLLTATGFRKPLSVSGAVYTKFGNVPEEIKFNWGNWDPSKFKLDDFATGFIRFEGGLVISFEVAWAANVSHVGEVGYMKILGDKGGIEARGDEAMREVSFHSRTSNFLYDAKPIIKTTDMAYEMIKSFVISIIEDKEPPVTGYQSVVLHAIIDAVYESSVKGREVFIKIPEDI